MPSFVSFDNDLGEVEEGKHAVQWLVNRCLDNNRDFPDCAVHSKNNQAADYMIALINSYRRFWVDEGNAKAGGGN